MNSATKIELRISKEGATKMIKKFHADEISISELIEHLFYVKIDNDAINSIDSAGNWAYIGHAAEKHAQ